MQRHEHFARLVAQFKKAGQHEMDTNELLSKLDLIEEQARLTLEEFPRRLTPERQRMIIALIKQIRWAIADASAQDPEATVLLPS